MKILVLNLGSSSQKSALYEISGGLPAHPPTPVWEGKIEWTGDQAEMQVQNSKGANLKRRLKVESRPHAIEQLLNSLWTGDTLVVSAPSEIDIVGHRIVHGGKDFEQAIVITPEVKSAIARMSIFAPLHNRAELEGIEIVERHFGNVPQVRYSTPAFTADCRKLPPCTPALTSGSPGESGATASMGSINSIALRVPRNFSAVNSTH